MSGRWLAVKVVVTRADAFFDGGSVDGDQVTDDHNGGDQRLG